MHGLIGFFGLQDGNALLDLADLLRDLLRVEIYGLGFARYPETLLSIMFRLLGRLILELDDEAGDLLAWHLVQPDRRVHRFVYILILCLEFFEEIFLGQQSVALALQGFQFLAHLFQIRALQLN